MSVVHSWGLAFGLVVIALGAGCGDAAGEPPIKVIPNTGGTGQGGTGSGADGGSAAGSGTGGSAAGSGTGGSGAGSGTGGSGTGGGGGSDPCNGNCTAAGATCQPTGECTCAKGNIDINPATSAANCVSSKIKGIEVGVAITHYTVGELTIKLRGPDGTIITLASRPGLLEWADNGFDDEFTQGSGAVADVDLAYMIFFNDTASVVGEDIGKGLSTNQVVGLVGPTKFRPDRGKAPGPTKLVDAFVGKFADGQWTMCVGDSVPEPINSTVPDGALDKWRLNLQLEFTTSDQTYYPGQSIPDDGYNGQLSSMGCHSIVLK